MNTEFQSLGFQWVGNSQVYDHTFFDKSYDSEGDQACMNACRYMERCAGFEIEAEGEMTYGEYYILGYAHFRCWFKDYVNDRVSGTENKVYVKDATVISFMDDLRASEAILVPEYDFHPDQIADDDEFTMGEPVYGSTQECAHKCTHEYPDCQGFVTDPVSFECWLKSEIVPLTEYHSDEDHKIAHVYVKKQIQ